MKLFFLWVMLYLCPDAHGVLLVDQEVSTPKSVVRNAPCQAREVLDTVCWGPLYVEFVIIFGKFLDLQMTTLPRAMKASALLTKGGNIDQYLSALAS